MRFLCCCLLVMIVLSSNNAEASDVTLETDHPHYPGEGAFQTVEDCVRFATRGKSDPQDRAIAMYSWFLNHQWHLMSPMEWCVPGRVPDSADPGDYETVVFDANRARFSYGYGLCGTVHAWNEVYWKAAGFPARRREFPNHINSEIFYDKKWHAFDTDMAGLLFRKDGSVAGYDDIQNDVSLVDSVKPPLPHYPFAWPSDFETMKKGWQEVAKRPSWYRLYNGGYEAHPGIIQLRPGETFTRYFDRDQFGGPERRRFWHHKKGGPERKWTYFDNGTPIHDGKESNSRSLATYCNGEFVYEPDLSSEECRDGMSTWSKNAKPIANPPGISSADGNRATVTFRHFSPYVICGDPVDDANPMSKKATDGFVVTGRLRGNVTCEVSADEGQSWQPVPLLAKPGARHDFDVDLTESVKGRYGWQVRFSWDGRAGIEALKFTTVTQVNQAMYPRLTEQGCQVNYHSKPRGVVAVLPNFGLPETNTRSFEETSMRSPNLKYQPRSPKQRYAYQAKDKKPAHLVFKIEAPRTLTEIRAAVRYQIPVPPPPGCDFRLEVSWDAGATWTEFSAAEIPEDNEFSSGWLYGSAAVPIDNCHKALVRFHMSTPGRRASLIGAQLYGIYKLPPPGPVSLEFGWLEDGTPRTYREELPAKVVTKPVFVPTKTNVKDQFVRIRALSRAANQAD